MAITKEQKKELVETYRDWLNQSQAVILTEYVGLTMNDMDTLRHKIREIGGEFHVVKNTLVKLAFEEAGLSAPEGYFENSTAIGFALADPPALAKTMMDFAKTAEFLKIKGGYLENSLIRAEDIKALAELPPLPVMQAKLMGTILAPASRLVRTLAEPARQVAAVLKVYAEKETASAST
ncbi:MAG: 50S ribosomal protein L10 [Anaerolineales bacterium]